MTHRRSAHRAMALDRCPSPAAAGRDYALSPSNAHTPGP
jgi:hypothetical protein